jgi:cytochrome c oxidase cbb3-type subunit III
VAQFVMRSSAKICCALLAFEAAFCVATGFAGGSQTRQQNLGQKDSKPASTRGEKTFASTCASCHGLDGRGGERAPNIAESPKAQRLSDAQTAHIIENGIPGTGMPAFHTLKSSSIRAVVTYLRTLQGTNRPINLPGNRRRGEAMFFGKAGCSGCHMAAGKGGFIASDLSGYARTHNPEEIRNTIVSPAPSGDRGARLVTAILHGGEKYVGRIRNQDNFSLQLQAVDGTFHFMAKDTLEGLEYSAQALMPSDYGSTLNSTELNDLVSYLMSVAKASTVPSETPKKEFEEE